MAKKIRSLVVLFTGLLILVNQAQASSDFVFIKQNSSPKYFDADQNQTGLCDAIYLNMQIQLQKQGKEAIVDNRLYPIKRVLAMLETGDAHVFCGAGRNEEREKRFHYSQLPVYSVSNVILMHESDDYVAESYQDLQDGQLIIGAYFGTSSARFLKKYSGIKVIDNFKTLDEAMQAVATQKVPYFYYHDLGLVYLVNNSDLPIKLMPKKLRTVDQWMIYSRQLDPMLVRQLDEALKVLTDKGIIADINGRYFKMD